MHGFIDIILANKLYMISAGCILGIMIYFVIKKKNTMPCYINKIYMTGAKRRQYLPYHYAPNCFHQQACTSIKRLTYNYFLLFKNYIQIFTSLLRSVTELKR